jgi:hypothetical protein
LEHKVNQTQEVLLSIINKRIKQYNIAVLLIDIDSDSYPITIVETQKIELLQQHAKAINLEGIIYF